MNIKALEELSGRDRPGTVCVSLQSKRPVWEGEKRQLSGVEMTQESRRVKHLHFISIDDKIQTKNNTLTK